MGMFGTKKPAQPKPKAQTPRGMLKANVDKGSAAGLLRDRKTDLDKALKDAGG